MRKSVDDVAPKTQVIEIPPLAKIREKSAVLEPYMIPNSECFSLEASTQGVNKKNSSPTYLHANYKLFSISHLTTITWKTKLCSSRSYHEHSNKKSKTLV